MKLFPSLIILLVFFSSCNSTSDNSVTKKTNTSISFGSADSNSLIDYKINKYKLFMGQSIDSITKIVDDIRHNYMVDDGTINNDGITHYQCIAEDLIKIGHVDCLPALFLTTDHKKLIGFDCSIMFSPNSLHSDSIEKYLEDIEPLFKALESEKNKSTLAKTFVLKIQNKEYNETFFIDTAGRGSSNTIFEYRKSAK